VALAEAVVRETVQNSTDAQAKANVPVRVRFAINEIEASNGRAFFGDIIAGLSPHLHACSMPVPASSEPLKALVVEDFGTTGLTGSVEFKDNGILQNLNPSGESDDDDLWGDNWRRFLTELGVATEAEVPDDPDSIEEWVESAVRAFTDLKEFAARAKLFGNLETVDAR
jgi:hypothetical protein